jgi:hypothetical protein
VRGSGRPYSGFLATIAVNDLCSHCQLIWHLFKLALADKGFSSIIILYIRVVRFFVIHVNQTGVVCQKTTKLPNGHAIYQRLNLPWLTRDFRQLFFVHGGCQIFRYTSKPKWVLYTKRPLNYQMAMEYNNIFNFEALKNLLKLGVWVWNYTNCQHCCTYLLLLDHRFLCR